MCKLATMSVCVCVFFLFIYLFNFITRLTCARWKDLSLFLKRDGKTKSQPRAKNSSSPRRSGSSLSEESFIIMVAKSRDRSIEVRSSKVLKQTPKSSVTSALEGCRPRSTALLRICLVPSTLHANAHALQKLWLQAPGHTLPPSRFGHMEGFLENRKLAGKLRSIAAARRGLQAPSCFLTNTKTLLVHKCTTGGSQLCET